MHGFRPHQWEFEQGILLETNPGALVLIHAVLRALRSSTFTHSAGRSSGNHGSVTQQRTALGRPLCSSIKSNTHRWFS